MGRCMPTYMVTARQVTYLHYDVCHVGDRNKV